MEPQGSLSRSQEPQLDVILSLMNPGDEKHQMGRVLVLCHQKYAL
jgi:hypothetical protein